MLDDLGVHTGIDVEGLIDAADVAGELVGRTGAEPGGRPSGPAPAWRRSDAGH